MSFLNKCVEESIKQSKLLAQMSEMSYRSLNGTRQTRSSFTNNDLKEQPDTVKPAVGSLTSEMIAQYKREQEGDAWRAGCLCADCLRCNAPNTKFL
jgi:hypothetical protein